MKVPKFGFPNSAIKLRKLFFLLISSLIGLLFYLIKAKSRVCGTQGEGESKPMSGNSLTQFKQHDNNSPLIQKYEYH